MRKTTTLALEFATNMRGKFSPEIKARIQALIDNPCPQTWNEAYSLIINHRVTVSTLWQAVLVINPNFCRKKDCYTEWSEIPTREVIINAINNAVFNHGCHERVLSKDAYQALKLEKYSALFFVKFNL